MLSANALRIGRTGNHALPLAPLTHTFLAGQCWGVLGANGVGKTTLLHTLAGLLPAVGGDVALANKPLHQWKAQALARRRGVLFQEQESGLPTTVRDALSLARFPHHTFWGGENAHDRECVAEALAQWQLEPLQHHALTALSGGERQRVALAALTVQQVPLWLVDEPSNHLDLRHQQRMFSHVQQHAEKGGCVLMSVHDANVAMRWCDHVLLMFENGEWQAGDTGTVLTAEALSQLYGFAIRQTDVGGRPYFIADEG